MSTSTSSGSGTNEKHRLMAVTEYGAPLELVTLDLPEPVGAQVLVKTVYSGMCHSDLHQIDGYFSLGGEDKLSLTRGREIPFAVGHEIEGEVIAVGPKAEGKVKIGQTYAIYPWGGCRKCGECRLTQENICGGKGKKPDIGNGNSVWGGYGSHVLVGHYDYCFDKEGIPDGLAGTYMCAGLTAFAAVQKIGTPPNGAKDVLILGLGGVGMQGFQMAKAMLGGAPLCADIRPEVLESVAKEGATVFNAKDKDVVKQIKKASAEGNGIYAVIDFVGSDATAAISGRVIRKGGCAVQIGLLGGKLTMPLAMFPLKAISYKGSMTGSLDECKEMFKLLKTGKVGTIPHHFRSITEVNEALDEMRQGKIVGRCILKHDWSGTKL